MNEKATTYSGVLQSKKNTQDNTSACTRQHSILIINNFFLKLNFELLRNNQDFTQDLSNLGQDLTGHVSASLKI